jgi:hypothetical protein
MRSSVRCGALAAAGLAAVVAGGGACNTGGGMLSGTGGDGVIQTGSGGSSVSGGAGGSGPIMTGAAGAAGGGDNCVETRQLTAKLVPDVMIVLDTAASMNNTIGDPCVSCGTTSKWQMAVEGIDAAIDATGTQVNWGLSFIASAADACDAGGVTVPLDENWQIKVELANRKIVSGNRPTRAAIDVVAAYLSGRSWAHLPAIVLITDGVPGCKPGGPDLMTDDTAGVVRAVGDALAAYIPTTVVGLGTYDDSADAALSQIATAGGSPAYRRALSAADVLSAMNAVAATADCAFVVPPPPTTDGSSSRENIRVLSDSGAIFQDAANGWTYTDITHTGIRLNGSSCDAAHAGAATYVSFICHPGLASP